MDGKLVPLTAPISASGTLEIFDGMTLDPAHVVIPWDPTKGINLCVLIYRKLLGFLHETRCTLCTVSTQYS